MRSFAATIVLAMLLLSSPVMASAGDYRGTADIYASSLREFVIDNTEGDTLDISYDVHVTDGPPLSIYFVTEEGRADYEEEFLAPWSTINTTDAHRKWEWSEEGVFHLVIVMADETSDEITTFAYDVSWYPQVPSLASPWTWLILLVLALVASAALLAWWMRRRRKGTAWGAP